MEEPAVPTQRRHDHTLGWRWGLAIAALGLSLLLIGLGDTRALTRHEVLAAQPAREMLASGNWIIPTIGGVPRTIKPPTTGWFIAASMAVFRSEAEWVARLPAVLAGVLTAVVVASLTARYFGRAAGAVAGFAQLTFYYTLMQARLAEADMLLSAAVTIAMTAFAVANVESPRAPRSDARWLPWLFYFAAGASMLLKLIAGPAFIFATAGCYWLWTRDRRVLRFLLNPIGIAIFLVVVASWYGAAAWTYPQIVQTWRQETFGRFSGDVGDRGRDPLLFYAYNVPLLLLPWLPFVAAGAVYGWRRGLATSPVGKFVVCWLVPGVLMLSASAWKAKHYAIPLLPGLTLIAAPAMLGFARDRAAAVVGQRYGVVAVAWLVLCAGVAGAILLGVRQHGLVFAGLIGALCVGGLLVIVAERRQSVGGLLGAIFGTAGAIAALAFVFVIPLSDGYRGSADFGRRVSRGVFDGPRPHVLPTPVYLVALGEAHVAYYVDPVPRRVDDLDAFVTEARAGGTTVAVIVAQADVGRLAEAGRLEVVDRMEARARDAGAPQLVLALFSPPARSGEVVENDPSVPID